jgi:hypothetical protein
MNCRRVILLALASALLTAAVPSARPRAGEQPASKVFPRTVEVMQLLEARCIRCHDQTKRRGNLDLSTREKLLRGGDSGPAVVPGDPHKSLLYRLVSHAAEPHMPESGPKLTTPQLALVESWIRSGAPYDRTLGKAGQAGTWWSLQPIKKPVPPLGALHAAWPSNPIDLFVLDQLHAKGLQPSPPADRRTLIRRVTFDLIGLPPTPEEIDAFIADPAPDAYEKLVDRLLASPHFGERWARHWMDVIHFAETHGHDQDVPREHAWPYRDYLINSFNQDKPFGRLVEEQIAGDVLYPDDPRAIVALGFLAAGPWDESSLRDIREDTLDRKAGQYLDRDDMVGTVGLSLLSTTVQCARCHDHKFDPVSQKEYYGGQAVFAGVDRANRSYDDRAVRAERDALTQRKRALQSGPAVALARFALLRWTEAQLGALPPPRLVYAAANDFAPDGSFRPAGGCRPVHVLKRGDVRAPLDLARPGALACVTSLEPTFANQPNEGQRRAALAKWVSDPKNPLTWRSITNRVWHYHFGRGIVATPSDFGRMGALPSHPELLDWLTAELLENGGSLKKLHRLIVTSAAYQQSSKYNAAAAKVDAENVLLWRMNVTRLDAESVRDTVLAVSGQLERTMGGPSVKHFVQSPGIHRTPKVDYLAFDPDSPGAHRRSVYRFIFRTVPDPFMDVLDCPDASQFTAVRPVSVTALQALALLNDPFMVRMSEHFAKRVASAGDERAQVRFAYRLALGREARLSEEEALTEYARRHGMANACRVLLNCNEFVFVK